ncbi:DUF6907 domain-containing protein [Streptomyces sp. NPDC088745]|uniref:DUF6907 domain-containing protein n=1 Tax=Streptomyces sp. NPDC088745 TaxID=3365884 RepID=UPI00383055A6
MSAPRTVTVHTVDHGPVTIPEPTWCVGEHEAEAYRVDIEHQGAETVATVETACHGPVPVLSMALVQRPFSSTETRVMAAVYVDGEWHEFDAAGLNGLIATIWRFAVDDMPRMAARLVKLNGVGR